MNGLIDTHQHVNDVSKGQYDKMHVRGSKYIDMVAMMHGILSYVKGCKLVEVDKIIPCDHWEYIIDLDINGYFKCEVRSYDKIGRIELNPSKWSHREKFEECLLKHMDKINFEEKLSHIERNPQEQLVNEFNKVVTHIINKSRKAAEGQQRNLPYSKKKLLCYNRWLY